MPLISAAKRANGLDFGGAGSVRVGVDDSEGVPGSGGSARYLGT
jgi:hypothetical protein